MPRIGLLDYLATPPASAPSFSPQQARTAGSDAAINLDLVTGLTPQRVFGFSAHTASYTTNWPLGPGLNYPWPTAPAELEIVCADNNDNAAGTGARAIRFEMLDPQLRRHFVNVPTNGTTATAIALPVTGGNPSTTNTAFRAERGIITLVGTQYGTNLGDIDVRDKNTGDVLLHIPAGTGRSRRATFSSAINERLWIPQGIAHVSGRRDADLRMRFQLGNNLDGSAGWGPLIAPVDIFGAVGRVAIGNGRTWLEVPPASDLELFARRADGNAGSTEVQLTATAFVETLDV